MSSHAADVGGSVGITLSQAKTQSSPLQVRWVRGLFKTPPGLISILIQPEIEKGVSFTFGSRPVVNQSAKRIKLRG